MSRWSSKGEQTGGPSSNSARWHWWHSAGQCRMWHHWKLSVSGRGSCCMRWQLLGVHLLLLGRKVANKAVSEQEDTDNEGREGEREQTLLTEIMAFNSVMDNCLARSTAVATCCWCCKFRELITNYQFKG